MVWRIPPPLPVMVRAGGEEMKKGEDEAAVVAGVAEAITMTVEVPRLHRFHRFLLNLLPTHTL